MRGKRALIDPSKGDLLYRRFRIDWELTTQIANAILNPAMEDSGDRVVQYYAEKSLQRGKDYAFKLFSGSTTVRTLLNTGHSLSRFILEHKAVPKAKAKRLMKALQVLIKARRAPRKLEPWIEKMAPGIQVMLESERWPLKADQPDAEDVKFKLGPFEVHNTLALQGKELDATKSAIDKATRFIKKSKVPRSNDLLYGPIMIVDKLSQPRTLAWYYPQDDTVYLRPHTKVGFGEVHNLIHELGHRYWAKLAPREKKAAWDRHHRSLRDGIDPAVEDPMELEEVKELAALKPGDPFPLKIKGFIRGGPPKVTDVIPRGRDVGIRIENERGKSAVISLREMARAVAATQARNQRVAQFPTPYSSTDWEEHFCEAFAMYAMGKLPIEHKEAFEKIWVD